MKRLFQFFGLPCAALLLSVLLTGNACASTIYVSGNITFNTSWTADTVKVNGDVTVNSGVTLTIAPGTVILFQGHYKLNVQGRLVAVGLANDLIRFSKTDTTGFSNITSNNGGWYGVRFYNNTSSDTSKLVYCHFEYGKANGNGEDGHGGAVYASYFHPLLISGCTFYCNLSKNNGGAVYLRKSDALVKWSTFRANRAASGGGIYLSSGSPKVYYNTIYSNLASSGGGGVFCADTTLASLVNNLIYGNMGQLGGAVGCYVSAPTLHNNTMAYNRATHGGALSCITASPTLRNCILYGNTGSGTGNQVSLLNTGCNPNFYYCDVFGGTAAFGGSGASSYAGIYQNNISAVPQFTDTAASNYLIRQTSPCMDAGTTDTTGLKLFAVDIAGNTRINMSRIDIGAYERQQIVFACGNISQNTTWSADTVKLTCDLIIDNGITLTIQPKVYVQSQDTFAIFVNGRILASGNEPDSIVFTAKNQSAGWQGFVFDNVASGNDTSKFSFCRFSYAKNPSASGGAFSITNSSKLRFNSCNFRKNFARNGGAIYASGSVLRIVNCLFRGNMANTTLGHGSAIACNSGSNLQVNRTTFAYNQSADGGAVYAYLSAPVFSRCVFSNNLSATGGAISCDSAGAKIINSLVVNNTAIHGGGIYLYRSNPDLTSSSVAYNDAASDGGGLWLSKSAPRMNNNILYNNASASGNQAFINDTNCFPRFYYCDVQGDTTAFGKGGIFKFKGIYQNNIDTLPAFMAPPAGTGSGFSGMTANWAPGPCSKLYNRGNTDTTTLHLPAKDLGGNTRIYNGRIDIGAFELIKPSIVSQPQNVSVCLGDTAVFTVGINASFPVTYQWQYSSTFGLIWNNAPAPAGDSVYTINGVSASQDGYLYRCIISAACMSNITSLSGGLTVSDPPVISNQPVNDTVCQNSPASFAVSASGTNIGYQWQQQAPGGATWTNCSGSSATTATYNIASAGIALNGYKYRCIVSGNCPPDTITVIATLVVKALPSISNQPSNVSICEGQNASFSVIAGGTGIHYQWEESTNGGSSWANAPGASTSSTYSLTAPPATMNGYKYRCIVSGDCTPPATSNVVTLTINTPPFISLQPSTTHICIFGDTTISVTAGGGNLSYQWKTRAPGSSVWVNASGTSALSNAYQITNAQITQDGTWFRCFIHGSCAPDIYSDSVQLFVHPQPSVYAGPDTTILLSESVILDAGSGYSSYHWSTGASTQTINIVGSAAGVGPHMYTVTVTNSYGCSNSDDVVVTVIDDTGIEFNGSSFSLNVYPNPSDGMLFIHLSSQGLPSVVEIRNPNGQEVYRTAFGAGTREGNIDLGTLGAGIYYLTVRCGAESVNKKIVIY